MFICYTKITYSGVVYKFLFLNSKKIKTCSDQCLFQCVPWNIVLWDVFWKWVLKYIFSFTCSSFSRGEDLPTNVKRNYLASRETIWLWSSSHWLFGQISLNISEHIIDISKLGRIGVTDSQVLKGMCKIRYQKFLDAFEEKLFNLMQHIIQLRRKTKSLPE